MIYDLLIIGGGPAAITCAQVLGSASGKPYMADKKIGMIAYSKGSELKGAVLNNVYGIAKNTKGKDFLAETIEEIKKTKSIEQLPENPIIELTDAKDGYEIKTESETYTAKNVVLAIGSNPKMSEIKSLESFVVKHEKLPAMFTKSALKNKDQVVKDGLYVAGLTSGCASQVAIVSGSGANVAVQLLTKWNDGIFDHHHDK